MIVIGQEGIRPEDRKPAAKSFAQRMTEKTSAKAPSKSQDAKHGGHGISARDENLKRGAQSAKSGTGPSNADASPVLDNLVVILEPNAARFELHAADNRVLAGFLRHNLNVLMFNYVGFDSPGAQQFSLQVGSPGNPD